MAVLVQFQHRLDTAANWTSANPVLLAGEIGLDTTSGRWKAGDGTTPWNTLPYSMNTLLSGSGTPSAGLGVNGDVYIDVTPGAQKVFGPKAAGAWGAGQSIVGAAGAPGGTGPAGPGVPSGTAFPRYLKQQSATPFDTVWALPPVTDIQATTGARIWGKLAAGAGGGVELTAAEASSLLALATQSAQGAMSALDKKIVDNLHYDFVADFGGVGDDSTLNDTQIANAISTMPVGAVLFFPAGTYRFANVININVDKRFTFRGVNRYASIIKTTSATNNIFQKTVAGWYDMWTDLGFQSTVTKTGGAAIAVTVGNNVGMNVYRCWFTGMFRAIDYDGNQSGNLGILNDLDISAITNGGRGIRLNGATINIQIHNATINGGASTTSACMEVVASGAVQVTNCDWIQGTNVVLFNATAALGAQACYFTNCFFDQPSADVVLITGSKTHGRIKFTQCGIAPTGNNNAVNVNGTGAGAVGTADALPAGISIVDCDIYSANGTNTGAGVRVNGCQDINIQSCRITGFAGAGTGAGVRVTPSAGNVTKVRINGCIIGPNSNLTVNNTIAIWLEAGASALGALSITDNTLLGNTQPMLDSSTIVSTAMKNITSNPGMPQGMVAKATTGATVLTTTDTVVMSFPIAANSLVVGTTFIIDYSDIVALAGTATIRVRIGTAGTTADTAVLALTASASAAAVYAQVMVAITAAGASATFSVGGIVNATPNTTATLSPTFNSTVANFLTVSIASGTSSTRTVRSGTIQCPA